MATLHERADALQRSGRSLAQGMVLLAGVLGVYGLDEVLADGQTLTPGHVLLAAALGLGYGAAAWIHARAQAALARRNNGS